MATNQNADKTHCKHGHAFTPENTYLTGRRRTCKICHRATVNASYLHHQAARQAKSNERYAAKKAAHKTP